MLNPEILIVILLLINIIFQVALLYKKDNENWADGFNGQGNENDGRKTYSGCNCSSVARKTSLNAPFNDDSFLYK